VASLSTYKIVHSSCLSLNGVEVQLLLNFNICIRAQEKNTSSQLIRTFGIYRHHPQKNDEDYHPPLVRSFFRPFLQAQVLIQWSPQHPASQQTIPISD
jgi:hypothetical protein